MLTLSVTGVLALIALFLWRIRGVAVVGICVGIMLGVAGTETFIGDGARWAIQTGTDVVTSLNSKVEGK
ncbi:hypothetical protein ACWDT6_30030 [Nocardia grenadensis]|uniref:hypothetical protein n=1 Tax=Embleya sp. NPDC005971 TaxID=3156724 RepID=UPI0034011E9D